MKLKFLTLFLAAFVATSCVNCSGEKGSNVNRQEKDEKDELANKEKFQVYLCFGQSNMYGSADIEEIDKSVPKGYMMMSTSDNKSEERQLGGWYEATPPICNIGAGLSPADYFGRTMAEAMDEGIVVGLIGVAVPGCDIRLFDKDLYTNYLNAFNGQQWYQNLLNAYGRNPYERLISMARKAQKEGGVIKGMILHQGETNNNDKEWPNYVNKIYKDILADLSLEAIDVPLIAGEVAHADYDGTCASMNKIIDELPRTIRTAYVVSSQGCPVKDDHTHFNSEGVRTLGRRYAEKMLEVKGF